MWEEERAMELMDPVLLKEASSTTKAIQCIQIGLLCVQENAADRPNMSQVLAMLNNETMALPGPKRPAFFTVVVASEEEEQKEKVCSINNVTISNVDAR